MENRDQPGPRKKRPAAPAPKPAGFDPGRIQDLTEEQARSRGQKLRDLKHRQIRDETRRNRFSRVVVPIVATVLVLGGLAAVVARFYLRDREVEATEARAAEFSKAKAKEEAATVNAAAADLDRFMEDAGGEDGEVTDARDRLLAGASAAASDRALNVRETLAWKLFREGKAEEARSVVAELARERPDSIETLVLQGATTVLENPEEARTKALMALGEDVGHARAFDLLAAAYQIMRGRAGTTPDEIAFREREIADYAALLEAKPGSAVVLTRSGFQRLALSLIDGSRVEELDLAITELEHAVALLEEKGQANVELAAARHHLGRAHRQRAEQLSASGDAAGSAREFEVALAHLSKALDANRNSVDSVGQIIAIWRLAGDGNRALAEAESALTLVNHPAARSKLLEMIGGLYLEGRDYDAAEEAFRKALELNPRRPGAQIYLARVWILKGDYDAAAQYLERAVAKMPAFLEGQTWLGRIRLGQGRPGDARVAFEAALEIAPEDAIVAETRSAQTEARNRYYHLAASSLAWLYLEEDRDPVKARQAVERAQTYQDGSAHLLDTLGWIEYAEGEYAKAAQTLLSAIEGGADLPAVRYHLAASYAKLGRNEEALAELGKALAGKEAFPGRAEAEALREELRK